MQFFPLSAPPEGGFKLCLVRRDLEKFLTINGTVKHGIKERRSEFVIALHTGARWIDREEHWIAWAELPTESSSQWCSAKLFAPDEMKPVLAVLPQPVILRSLIIPAGLVFAYYSDRSWYIHQRIQGLRITDNDELASRCWLNVGNRQISSWLSLPPLNERLRTDEFP